MAADIKILFACAAAISSRMQAVAVTGVCAKHTCEPARISQSMVGGKAIP